MPMTADYLDSTFTELAAVGDGQVYANTHDRHEHRARKEESRRGPAFCQCHITGLRRDVARFRLDRVREPDYFANLSWIAPRCTACCTCALSKAATPNP